MPTFFELSRKAYFLGDILADDLLKIEYELQKTKTRSQEYSLQNQGSYPDQHLITGLPEIVVPNLPAIRQAVETNSTYQKVLTLSEAILEEEYDPLFEKRLRFFLKTGVNENSGAISSGDVTAGVFFSTPLFRQTSEVLPYKKNRTKALLKKEQEDLLNETARLYNAYTEKVTDALTMFYRLKTVSERLRRSLLISENRMNSSGAYGFDQHILVLRHLDELLDTRLEYIAVQESLYRQLLHLFTLTQTDWRQDFLKGKSFDTEFQRGRKGHRAIYVWGKEFQQYDNQLLNQSFLAKGISTAIISASKTVGRQKLDHFIELAKLSGINVELMVSENSWVSPEKWPTVQGEITALCAFGQTIHLDIEPHTLPDYQDKRQQYDAWFLDLIRKIRAITTEHGVGLSVSLPVLHSAEFVETIAQLVDHIYAMAYGVTDQEKLHRKLTPFANIDQDKLVLGLRPADFGSELRQEEFIDATVEQTKLSSFALHDLAQFFTMAAQESL